MEEGEAWGEPVCAEEVDVVAAHVDSPAKGRPHGH